VGGSTFEATCSTALLVASQVPGRDLGPRHRRARDQPQVGLRRVHRSAPSSQQQQQQQQQAPSLTQIAAATTRWQQGEARSSFNPSTAPSHSSKDARILLFRTGNTRS